MATQPVAMIREAITRNGPIGFDEFMQLALYSPAGYYAGAVPGEGSDYRTAPSLSPWFARLTAVALKKMWGKLGRPDIFRVIEPGAGGADLALGVLELDAQSPAPIDPTFLAAVRWVFVEPLAQIRRLQQHRMSSSGAAVSWVSSLDELTQEPGVILANEVLDNFPFKVFEVTQAGAVEVLVGMKQDRFVEVPGPAAEGSNAVAHLEPGDRYETCPAMDEWINAAHRTLSAGFLLVVDYGDIEPDIWLRNPAGTVVTYRQEHLGTDPFSNVGRADITHRVNFSALERSAVSAGFTDVSVRTQRDWLTGLGLGDVIELLRLRQREKEGAGDPAGAVAAIAQRSRASALAARGGMGDFQVLTAFR